jgi:hypothetical protein
MLGLKMAIFYQIKFNYTSYNSMMNLTKKYACGHASSLVGKPL